jgi:hypothetical protein
MRTFRDEGGRDWDVVPGRESWGGIVALFIPRGDATIVRQVALDGSSPLEAASQLSELSEDELRALLRESEPRNP